MASIICQNDRLIVSSGAAINGYRHEEKFELRIPASLHTSDAIKDKDNEKSDSSNRNILCMKFSCDSRFFAASDDEKNLAIWDTSGTEWTFLNSRKIVRRAVAMHFSKHEKLLVADKSGDVYEIDVYNKESTPRILMGHVSMLLDLCMSEDDKFLITCDRDERIRVSHYPNAYNIQCFCMGHSEYIINIFILPSNPDILVSGSGDGTVRFWQYKSGVEVGRICCPNFSSWADEILAKSDGLSEETSAFQFTNKSNESVNPLLRPLKALRFSSKDSVLAVLFAKCKEILLFQINENSEMQIKWQHIQTIHLSEEAWDVCFSSDGLLWILLPNQDQCVEVFEPNLDKKIQFKRVDKASNQVESTMNLITSDWSFFESSLNVKNDFHLLFKQWYDNVKEYYSRKKERCDPKKMKT